MNERVFVAGWQLVFSHSNANGPLGDFRYLLYSSSLYLLLLFPPSANCCCCSVVRRRCKSHHIAFQLAYLLISLFVGRRHRTFAAAVAAEQQVSRASTAATEQRR
jgi:hypothetical protein